MKETSDEWEGLTLDKFTGFIREYQHQPAWRATANDELNYRDGNQLKTDRLEALKERGVPPVIDNMLLPAVESLLGMEAKNRTDWKVIPESASQDDQNIADALNYKLNQAEKRSRADRCISDAYESQISVGVGWVEVARSANAFEYPYQCRYIDYNDVYYDWFAIDPLLKDARWLIRRKWVTKQEAIQNFPEHEDKINMSFLGWTESGLSINFSQISSDLRRDLEIQQAWAVGRDEWLNVDRQHIRLYEVWYRNWVEVEAINLGAGRIAEFDKKNPEHIAALLNGAKPFKSQSSRVYVSIWAGCHKLTDDESPYTHGYFPYVPFWGYKEKRTGIPYGKIRNAKSLQDLVNIYHSKICWALSSMRTIRTVGAVVSDDEDFRAEVSGLDADIVLNAEEMAQPGARFELIPNNSLTPQHMQALETAKQSIRNIMGVSPEFQGYGSTATSNSQEVTRIQQSGQAIANLDDNKNESRTRIGEILLSLIVQDIGNAEVAVDLPGDILTEARTVVLNQTVIDYDGDNGVEHIVNDLQRTLLKVELSEVPTTQSYKLQQYASISEIWKSSPPQYQSILMPYMFNYMDLGEDRQKIIEAVKSADNKPDPEMQKVQAEIELKNKEFELKLKELELKAKAEERSALLTDAQIKQITATVVKTLNEAQFSAYQVGAQVMMNPAIAPVADVIMDNSGYQMPNPEGVYPGLQNQMPLNMGQPVNPQAVPPVQQNTHPQFPANANIPNEPAPVLQTPETLEAGTGQIGLQTMRNEQIPPQPEL